MPFEGFELGGCRAQRWVGCVHITSLCQTLFAWAPGAQVSPGGRGPEGSGSPSRWTTLPAFPRLPRPPQLSFSPDTPKLNLAGDQRHGPGVLPRGQGVDPSRLPLPCEAAVRPSLTPPPSSHAQDCDQDTAPSHTHLGIPLRAPPPRVTTSAGAVTRRRPLTTGQSGARLIWVLGGKAGEAKRVPPQLQRAQDSAVQVLRWAALVSRASSGSGSCFALSRRQTGRERPGPILQLCVALGGHSRPTALSMCVCSPRHSVPLCLLPSALRRARCTAQP